MSDGSVVTFYSYKGGVGRTLALANVGALLCRWGYKVLCVDWDLEAPGLHLYYERWSQEPSQHQGLVDLIHAQLGKKKVSWRQYLTEVKFPDIAQPLALLTAGRQDDGYVQRLQGLDWETLYERHDFGNFLERMRNEWKKEFDFILIDSRTGITDIGGICTVQLPDYVVLLFTANFQSLKGSLDVVARARRTRNSLPFDRTKLLALPIPTRFEGRIEYEMAQEWLQTFTKELAPLYAEWIHKDVKPADLLNHLRIPYIPYWSFGEKLPVIEKGTSDPEDIGFSLETIAALIAQKFAYTDVLTRNRDSFVASARKIVGQADLRQTDQTVTARGTVSSPLRVFVSYAHKDGPLVEELSNHLKLLEREGVIQSWIDKMIPAGNNWTRKIETYLAEADIVLLLISPDYLASDYTYSVELPAALKKNETHKAITIPILLRPTAWQNSPLSSLQAAPANGMPITKWENRDEAWLAVMENIRAAASQLLQQRQAA
ncbi:MAG: TIR domain-containing protein [Blastocatellia bacterium]